MILFIYSLCALFIYDIVSLVCPFRWLYGMVRGWKVAQGANQTDVIDRVCTAVNYACIWYPKQVFCLQRSAAATKLLRRHGIPALMAIGAKRMPLRAHAWVELKGRVINDKPEVQTDYLVMDRC